MNRKRRDIAGEHDVIGSRPKPEAQADLPLFGLQDEPHPPGKGPGAGPRPPVKPPEHRDGQAPLPPFVVGSDTSLKAAERMRGRPAATKREQVRLGIAATGAFGATRGELESTLGIRGNTLHPRVLELLEARQIVESVRTRNGSHVLLAPHFAPYCPGCKMGDSSKGASTCHRCILKGEQ